MKKRLIALMLVGLAVGLNLLSAVVLKETSDLEGASITLISILILIVVGINVLRVVFWAAIHKRYRLSDSYPLTSVFFPMILLISWLYGETIGACQIVGTFLITVGVLLLIKDETAVNRQNHEPVDVV